MIGLETERLSFRQWKKEDFIKFSAFFSIDENTKYVGGVKSEEESWRLMATYVGHYELNGFSYLALEEKHSGNLIGSVGLWKSYPWPEHELGYWLLPEFQGKGFAHEAGLAVKQYALNKLNLKSLVSYIDPTNSNSKKLALRLNAQQDSVIQLLDFGKHEVYRYK